MPPRPAQRVVDPISLVPALICGIVLGIGAGWLVHGNASPSAPGVAGAAAPTVPAATPPVQAPGQPVPAPDPAPPPSSQPTAEAAIARALEQAVRASAPDGRMDAAVMLDAASEPVLRPAEAVPAMRAWSMIKAVTALTLLELPGAAADPALTPFVERALRRSDNCAQRKLSLELGRRLGAGPDGVRAAIRNTLARAGATIDVADAQRDTRGAPACAAPQYPGRLTAADASAGVVQLGTSRWRPADAVRFVYALRANVYDPTASAEVLRLMGAGKLRSQEVGSTARLAASPSWGAGRTFGAPCWRVAYKAGWGGSNHGDFLAGQMGTVDLPGGRWLAFAVMFHPTAQPAIDDPGEAHADRAIEGALTRLKSVLRRQFGACP